MFNDIKDEKPGVGIGGQSRVQLNDRVNTEWFADFITSGISSDVVRNDYHIGWSVMYYPGKNLYFEKFLQPYLIVGHCFDKSIIFFKSDKSDRASRLSMATQAGAGCHLNITPALDLTLSGQYMLHFGRELEIIRTGDRPNFQVADFTHPGGHLLLTLSANFKFGRLWKR